MKKCGRVGIETNVSLISVLIGYKWSVSLTGRLTADERVFSAESTADVNDMER
jgi:hypothetical protein